MSFLKRLFRGRSHPYDNFPQFPFCSLELPKIQRQEKLLDKFALDENLAQLTQAIPQRVAKLWQGREQNQYQFLAFIRPGKEEQTWLIERLGGENVLKEARWEKIQAKTPILGLEKQLVCLCFQYWLANRYQLCYRLYCQEREEAWLAYDGESKQNVLCTIIKPLGESKSLQEVIPRQFVGEKHLIKEEYPEFLDVLAEGDTKPFGPFSFYRYKLSNIWYVITTAPPEPFPMSLIVSRHKLNFTSIASILYQVARCLACLHEQGWTHGHINPDSLWLSNGQDQQPTVYLNGFTATTNLNNSIFNVIDTINSELGYISPEYFNESTPLASVDQFLLGLTIYHLVSGKNPLVGVSASNFRNKLESLDLLHDKFYPQWFAQIVNRMLAFDPAARFSNLREMITTLAAEMEQWQKGSEETATHTSEEREPKRIPAKDVKIAIKPKTSHPKRSVPLAKTTVPEEEVAVSQAVPEEEVVVFQAVPEEEVVVFQAVPEEEVVASQAVAEENIPTTVHEQHVTEAEVQIMMIPEIPIEEKEKSSENLDSAEVKEFSLSQVIDENEMKKILMSHAMADEYEESEEISSGRSIVEVDEKGTLQQEKPQNLADSPDKSDDNSNERL